MNISIQQIQENQLEECLELIKQRSRKYAKRQYTWFNNQMNVKWFDVDFNNFNNTIEEVKEYIKQKTNERQVIVFFLV